MVLCARAKEFPSKMQAMSEAVRTFCYVGKFWKPKHVIHFE